MLTAAFPTIGVLDTSLPPTTDPLYQLATLSLDIHKLLKNMSDAGMEVQQPEVSDVSTMTTDFANFANTFDSWIESAAIASTAGDPIPANPTPPALAGNLAVLLAGGWGAIIPVLVRMAVDLIIRYIERRLDPETEVDEVVKAINDLQADLGARLTAPGGEDLAQVLDDLHTTLEAASKTSENIRLTQVLEDAMIDRNAADERFAILWALARQALRILVTTHGDFDDVIYDDVPS
jgi:hypothetical protein